MTTDPTEYVRRRELAETLPEPDEAFAAYVTGSAFALTLSQGMISALATAEHGITHGVEYSLPVSEPRLHALERRGLVRLIGDRRRRFEDNPRMWSDVYEITRPGALVLDLLAEARLVPPSALRRPLPPPPPGWLDPRPRIVPDGSGRLVAAPSRREQAEVAP